MICYAQRKLIERNYNLANCAKDSNLHQFLFTTPIAFRKGSIITGFNSIEMKLFDININRSYSKKVGKVIQVLIAVLLI
jgi:hypothetical protein